VGKPLQSKLGCVQAAAAVLGHHEGTLGQVIQQEENTTSIRKIEYREK
jgi:hypothetical protein